MTTSARTHFLSEVESGASIPVGKLAYFQQRLRNNLYDFVVTKFLEREAAGDFSRAELARRIGKSPAVITRLLSSPRNWRLSTLSDLLLGIAAEELLPASQSVLGRTPNSTTLDLMPKPTAVRPAKTRTDTNQPFDMAA